jgi:hypothetical protein
LPVLKATDRASAIDVLASSQAALDGLLVITTSMRVTELRRYGICASASAPISPQS